MCKSASLRVTLLLLAIVSAPVRAQHAPDVIERGKRATALVEVKTTNGGGAGPRSASTSPGCLSQTRTSSARQARAKTMFAS